ncbi:AAA family ATPase [Pontibacterium sp. N1Y112]|uniref:AAA family ATPase n=1 Tax=Pontibacterium sinense TaxID=2781979 RepID=A0A8J7K5D5_9GAMM|nr:AAA family ATPase [Pontibacterium sinense]MBE9396815.1 AAA family ATPase [Pontibacterium sinense]
MSKKSRNSRNRTSPPKKNTEANSGVLEQLKQKINSALPSDQNLKPLGADITVLQDANTEDKQKAEAALTEILHLLEAVKLAIYEHETAKNNYEKLSMQAEKLREELEQRERELVSQQDCLVEEKAALSDKQLDLSEQMKAQVQWQDELETLQSEASAGFVNMQREALEAKRKSLTELEKEHNQKLQNDWESLRQLERTLLEKERELGKREADAKAGFVSEQKAALLQVEDLKSSLEHELLELYKLIESEQTEHQNNLKCERELFEADRSRQSSEQQALLNAERKNLEREKASVEHSQQALLQERLILEARKRAQQEWESELESKVKDGFSSEIICLQSQLEQERDNRRQDQNKLARLQKELIQFKDLQRSLDDADIKDVQDELEELRQKNKALKAKLHTSDQDDLEEKCEALEELVGDQRDTLSELRRDLEEANNELHKTRLSTAAKHNLEKEKRILELHNKTLDSAISGLQVQLDDLIEKQQGSEVFPALSMMDKKHKREAVNLQPIPGLKGFADQLRFGIACIYPKAPLYYREKDIRLFLGGLAMSNLHILQGMSGTGKTSLAKAFAKVVGGNCTDIAVQAGWRDKDDLLGHYNAFEKKYYEREVLQALYRAQLPEYKDRINIILLDEMNLSRPEQYFADFLSAMEKQPQDREIVLLENDQKNSPHLLKDGRVLKVPENIWFVGTANHDETTNEFADKTYDRSHVMELVRNEDRFNADAYEPNVLYSFNSLVEAFDTACLKNKGGIDQLLKGLIESELLMTLEDRLDLNWGNRLERHASRFIPVVMEAGGTMEEGLDHLLATKLFRRGKVTGRFDINISDLDAIEDALLSTWKTLKLTGVPEGSLDCITKDKKRMERNF